MHAGPRRAPLYSHGKPWGESAIASIDLEPVRRYVAEKLGGRRDLVPPDEASLVEEGILDSFGLAELIAMLESRYPLKIPDRDLKLEVFESISKIARYLEAHAGE